MSHRLVTTVAAIRPVQCQRLVTSCVTVQGCCQLRSAIHGVLAGTLPPIWADPLAFSSLSTLVLWNTLLSGHLPPSWGSNGSFAAMRQLELGSMGLTGSLPAEWGSPTAWQGLQYLAIVNANITGGCGYVAITRCLKRCCCEFVSNKCLQWSYMHIIHESCLWADIQLVIC